jgi:hypothetical protein
MNEILFSKSNKRHLKINDNNTFILLLVYNNVFKVNNKIIHNFEY